MPSFIEIMACCLFGTKSLSKAVLGYFELDPSDQISVKLESKYNRFHLRNFFWKQSVQKAGHFVLDSMGSPGN